MPKSRNKPSPLESSGPKSLLTKEHSLAVNLPGSSSFSLIVSFRDGVAYEGEEEWGMSHFLEHVHLLGCPRYPSLGEVSRVVETMGTQLSAFSTRDSVSYWIKAPAWHGGKAREVLRLILENSDFSPEKVESEKAVVLREMARERSDFRLMSILSLEESLLFPSSLSRNVLGSRRSVSGFTPESLRRHKEKFYRGGNMFLAAAGNLGKDRDAGFLQDFAGLFPRGGRPVKAPDFPEAGTPPAGVKRAMVLNYPGLRQVGLALGWKIEASSRGEIESWRILNTFLGVGFGSLLYRRLREERALTYLVSTRMRFFGRSGVYQILLDVREEDIRESLRIVHLALEETASECFEKGELQRARGLQRGNTVLRLEDTMEWARWLNQALLRGEREPIMDFLQEESGSPRKKQISRLARKYLAPEDCRLCLAGEVSGILRNLPEGMEAEVI